MPVAGFSDATPALAAIERRLAAAGAAPVVIARERQPDGPAFLRLVDETAARFAAHEIGPGTVCGLCGDWSLAACAAFFAVMRLGAIVAPFTAATPRLDALCGIAGVTRLIRLAPDGTPRVERRGADDNTLIAGFRREGRPGLVVFTSGSTGEPKGILHDCERVAEKFLTLRRGRRTVLFLLMDHFGGFNTFLAALAYPGGAAICPADRSPEAICRTIEETRAELLPTTPSFLRLLLASGAVGRHDLSSVELVTYGAEPMPASTLEKARRMLPRAQFKQTYGLSELGVLRSQSPDAGTTWLRVGGEGFETRVVDGVLWIRSSSSMIGYLNAPSPFDAEGWMNTGDEVEERDGLIRFRGRRSEVINVGGEKVFPAEVEEVLLGADNVRDAAVYGQRHPLLGQVVCARVVLDRPEPPEALAVRLRQHCAARLPKVKVPARITIAEGGLVGTRLKKVREGE